MVASLMLMHRIEAKPSSAPDICATRPRSVQRRVRQQLAQGRTLRHRSDSDSYRGYKRSAPGRRCHTLRSLLGRQRLRPGHGRTGPSTLLNPSAKTTHVAIPDARQEDPNPLPRNCPWPVARRNPRRYQREFRAGCPTRIASPIGHHHAGRRPGCAAAWRSADDASVRRPATSLCSIPGVSSRH